MLSFSSALTGADDAVKTSESVTIVRPLMTTSRARYYTRLYYLLNTMTDSNTTKTMHSIFSIWYELAEISMSPVKFKNEPNVSSSAGAAKSTGLALFFS